MRTMIYYVLCLEHGNLVEIAARAKHRRFALTRLQALRRFCYTLLCSPSVM